MTIRQAPSDQFDYEPGGLAGLARHSPVFTHVAGPHVTDSSEAAPQTIAAPPRQTNVFYSPVARGRLDLKTRLIRCRFRVKTLAAETKEGLA